MAGPFAINCYWSHNFAIFAILDYYLSHNFQAKKTLANKEILSLNTLVFKNLSVFWWKHHYLETLITGISPLTRVLIVWILITQFFKRYYKNLWFNDLKIFSYTWFLLMQYILTWVFPSPKNCVNGRLPVLNT